MVTGCFSGNLLNMLRDLWFTERWWKIYGSITKKNRTKGKRKKKKKSFEVVI